jgi:threonine dehydrogenase-like Zn-dependent dehydrogenase
VQGSYPTSISITYQPAFMKEATFILSRDHGQSDVHAVLGLLSKGDLRIADLVNRVVKPEQAAETYAELGDRGRLLTAVFDWTS